MRTAVLLLAGLVGLATPTPTIRDGKVVHDAAWLEHRKEYVKGTAQWQPRHVHLAYGHETDEVIVTYSTLTDTEESMVEYGTEMFALDSTRNGTSTKFVDGGDEHSTQFIHRVHLSPLKPNTTYFYHVGCSQGWSPVFGFKTVPEGTQGWELKLAVFGDMGAINARALNSLQQDTHRGDYHMAIHVGDFGYDMAYENGAVGDIFMSQIEPIAGYIPYMTCPGNHEWHYDFLQYKNRFSMPNYTESESLYFSYNVGPVHFVAISTETYFPLYSMHDADKFTDIPVVNELNRTRIQMEWLVADLEEATRPEVRAKRPWIIMYGHRPLYCSNYDGDDCQKEVSILRNGLDEPQGRMFPLEPLLMKYSVDMFIGAHEHSYERLFPLYNHTILKGDGVNPYYNPRGPTHITTGSAGCHELFDHFAPEQPEWSAFRLDEYGFTKLNVLNHTHLYMEQVSDENDVVIDSMLLVREDHTSYPPYPPTE